MDKAIGFPTAVIRWIVIYPVGSTIQLLNNWGEVDSTIRQNRAGDFTLSFYSCDRVQHSQYVFNVLSRPWLEPVT